MEAAESKECNDNIPKSNYSPFDRWIIAFLFTTPIDLLIPSDCNTILDYFLGVFESLEHSLRGDDE